MILTKIASVVLVDPPTILLHLPDVCYNFVCLVMLKYFQYFLFIITYANMLIQNPSDVPQAQRGQ